MAGFYQEEVAAGALGVFKFHRRPLQQKRWMSASQPAFNASGKDAERREERRAAVADLMEARISNGGGNTAAAARGRRKPVENTEV